MFYLSEKSHLGKKFSEEQEAFPKNVKKFKVCSLSSWELIRAFTQLFRKRWIKECLLKHHIQSTWQNPNGQSSRKVDHLHFPSRLLHSKYFPISRALHYHAMFSFRAVRFLPIISRLMPRITCQLLPSFEY